MHRHACGVGHYYECADDDCVCICNLPMNGNDHSGCSVEIRLCPAHENEQDRPAPEPGFVEIDFSSVKPRTALPHRNCGCSEIEPSEGVGWCLYSPEIENQHFAYHCPGVPERKAAGTGAARETVDISSLQEEVDEQQRPEDRAQGACVGRAEHALGGEQSGLSPDAPTLTKLARQRYRRDGGWTT
jgi:hypothetical protein